MKKTAVLLFSWGAFLLMAAGPSHAEQVLEHSGQELRTGESFKNEGSSPGKNTGAKEKELLVKGIEYYKSESYAEAVDIFLGILDLNPDNTEAGKYLLLSMRAAVTAGDVLGELFLLGMEQFLQKEYKDAAESFQLVLGMNPDHGKAKKYLLKAREGLEQVQAREKLARIQAERERKRREETAAHSVLRRDIGPYLLDSRGNRISSDTLLEKKYVLLYFSAQWCPPCRAYTPRLVDFYNKHSGKGGLEVILVSSDRTSGEMLKYMKDYKMEWRALPHGRAMQRTLSVKYNVRGIPRLIALDANGRVIMDSERIDRNRMLDELARRL